MDLREALKEIADDGFECVEIGGFGFVELAEVRRCVWSRENSDWRYDPGKQLLVYGFPGQLFHRQYHLGVFRYELTDAKPAKRSPSAAKEYFRGRQKAGVA